MSQDSVYSFQYEGDIVTEGPYKLPNWVGTIILGQVVSKPQILILC